MATLILFFDGIGVGAPDPGSNPFAAIGSRRLGPAAGADPDAGCRFRPLDATLGVPGLPQSATGQTTLLTGVNAARHAGRHLIGRPGPTLRPLLERESLFLKLKRAGRRPTFANAYTESHLDGERRHWSATTWAVHAAGIGFRMWNEEGRRGEALFHDYSGEWLRRHGYPVPEQTAKGAAEVLVGLLDDHDTVLYEYFLTDFAGHRGSWDDKVEQARRVEALVDAVVETADLDRHEVLVISDHGNLEEGSHKRHTLNPVPLLVWGRRRDELANRIERLQDLTSALLSVD
jgi:hypothetical protein